MGIALTNLQDVQFIAYFLLHLREGRHFSFEQPFVESMNANSTQAVGCKHHIETPVHTKSIGASREKREQAYLSNNGVGREVMGLQYPWN